LRAQANLEANYMSLAVGSEALTIDYEVNNSAQSGDGPASIVVEPTPKKQAAPSKSGTLRVRGVT
jgi:hypothetical protein